MCLDDFGSERGAEVQANLDRAGALMRVSGVDAVIAASPHNVRYLTLFHYPLAWQLREWMIDLGGSTDPKQPAFAIQPLEGPSVLVAPFVAVADALVDPELDVKFYGEPPIVGSIPIDQGAPAQRVPRLDAGGAAGLTAVGALGRTLRELGLADASLGIEAEALSQVRLHAIVEALPRARIRDCSQLLRLVRAVKTDAEIGLLKRAATVGEEAALEALSLPAAGRTAAEVSRAFAVHVTLNGGEPDHFLYSPGGLGISYRSPFTFGADEVFFVDFGCTVAGYFSDSGTTVALGSVPDELERAHLAITECISAGESVLRPGHRASDAPAVMAAVCSEAGFDDAGAHGHGLGLEVRDYPILVPLTTCRQLVDECIEFDADLKLERGMVVNLEASIFRPELGSVHLERSYVVEQTGPEQLIAELVPR